MYMMHQENWCVITSYSIHYTKLYEAQSVLLAGETFCLVDADATDVRGALEVAVQVVGPGVVRAAHHAFDFGFLAQQDHAAMAADGRCAECHAVHGGERAGLLTKPKAELCASCHDEVQEWQGRKA